MSMTKEMIEVLLTPNLRINEIKSLFEKANIEVDLSNSGEVALDASKYVNEMRRLKMDGELTKVCIKFLLATTREKTQSHRIKDVYFTDDDKGKYLYEQFLPTKRKYQDGIIKSLLGEDWERSDYVKEK